MTQWDDDTVSAVVAALYQGPERATSVAENLRAVDLAAREAARVGAAILICPEMSATGYNLGPLVAQRAEPSHGPIADEVGATARRYSIAIAYGYPELAAGAVYNSVQVVSASGTPLAHYRKTHLFGALDRDHFLPGMELVVQFDLSGIRCGLLTCYDVEFPETVRAHADAGTQWLIVPTGLMRPFERVAKTLVPARAYESQMFITYVNRCGTEAQVEYCGLSCAVAPDGTELARAGAAEQLIVTEIDLAVLEASRVVNTYLQDRRRDLY
ncbi:carbon-nitrogen hydrolase family protein [Hoyosella subflava]|uniref:Putative nitrilase n=1 Tax=Hoyosella subflava (strain DSM 45089 / JCM 17490 / NBRC 109087 / DQS3-9A1) TaxID=443218 RepID=F6EGA2_HOYSD|nr:carbon-nitrogen hydrolase family protein [Hoyosella subflava]AEF39827.1 putative nitrilase [Hoyosella subflava DQS3-9A1]